MDQGLVTDSDMHLNRNLVCHDIMPHSIGQSLNGKGSVTIQAFV